MDSWHQFLQQQGAHFDGERLLGFGEQLEHYAQLLTDTVVCPLTNWASVLVQDGALQGGSQKLLQGQLTCDLDKLGQQTTLFGAHCTPKGRAVANFYLLQQDNSQVTLVLPRDQINNTTSSLGKYAPFFRVTLTQGNHQLLALAGPQAQAQCAALFGSALQQPGQCAHSDYGQALCVAEHQMLLLLHPEHCETVWQTLVDNAKPAGPDLWELLTIQAGIGHIRAATCEEFIPQMLNMQASHGKNGAISFKKGCYTGQEVVARMHYLGKLKRRMYRLQTHYSQTQCANIAIGDHCYLPHQTQSQGRVVNSARCGQEKMELLVVLTEKAAASEQLAFGPSPDSAQPIAVSQLPLPYPLEP
ncbi:CAF17-like 4Fe-4S cluster assembly/insertion protein YgfZ [Porticoccus sp. GXU_MW_L64]